MLTLNGSGHGYVEKIKFQVCFGVLLAVFLPNSSSTDEEKSLGRERRIPGLLASQLG